jgi:hypothetical protein
MPKLPSRAALLIPMLSLGLLVPNLSPTLTQADSLPTPCALVATANAADDMADTSLMLYAILPTDLDTALVAAPPLPLLAAPLPPGMPPPSGGPGARKPLGTDLRPPDAALLNQEPIMAARQLRESLSEKQRADLRVVLTKHEGALRQVRGRASLQPTEIRGSKPVQAPQEATLSEESAEVQRISDQIDQEIEPLLTPAQRSLLQKSRAKRPRAELPDSSDIIVAERAPGC